jgi:branched-chain amino acid transport system permease protein
MNFFLQLVVTGFALGMVYALVAIGFVIILKCSEVFNIAQGHFVLVGGTSAIPFWFRSASRYGPPSDWQ